MECLDATALADLFVEPQDPLRREGIERHIDGCEACRALVALFARLEDDDASAPSATVLAPTVESAPPTKESRALEAGDVIGARYVLERVVGEGGMGVVWAALDRASGGRVAVKVLKAASPELCRRFVREARVAASISHPNVLEVRSVVPLADGSPALVMELLEGRSLAAEIAAHGGKLDAHMTVGVLLPLVAAVRAAHAKGIVHRDLKPANVILARDAPGAEPVLTLLDFGLAKLVAVDDDAAEKITRSGAIVGTPHYMAPEQLFGERGVDGRADVWAIGAMAYECLTGKKPLDGKSYAQLVKSATKGVVRPIAELAPETPPALAALVASMLSFEAGKRPSIADVHAALDALSASG
jgi:eukaryotic-like serine/threonine-protein kinase